MQTTFLTEDQIWGDHALDVIKAYGRPAAPTDLAIVLGGLMGNSATTCEGEKSGFIWSASATSNYHVRSVYFDGGKGS